MNAASAYRIETIVLNDAVILPYHANLDRIGFSRAGARVHRHYIRTKMKRDLNSRRKGETFGPAA